MNKEESAGFGREDIPRTRSNIKKDMVLKITVKEGIKRTTPFSGHNE